MRKTIIALSIVIATGLAACSKSSGGGNPAPVTCSSTPSFSSTVNPIIQATCTSSGCHDAVSSNGPGALITYQRIFDVRASIRTAVNNGTMPKNGSLTNAQKTAILCWIDGGAPNN
jgi:hypothetical protein